jgi:hypothetical protein
LNTLGLGCRPPIWDDTIRYYKERLGLRSVIANEDVWGEHFLVDPGGALLELLRESAPLTAPNHVVAFISADRWGPLLLESRLSGQSLPKDDTVIGGRANSGYHGPLRETYVK